MKQAQFLLFAVIICQFGVLNIMVPFVKDDIMYQFTCLPTGYAFDYNHPISTISDIASSQYNHYMSWGGRALVHSFVQFFCGISGKWLYNLFATLMFAFWIPLYGKMAFPNVSFRQAFPYGIISTLSLWIVSEETTVFYAGVAFGMNYLYPSLFCMFFLLAVTSERQWTSFQKMLLYVISFVAGWSQEMFVVGTGAFIVLWAFTKWKHLSSHQYISIVLFFVGSCLLVFAPGNFARSEHDCSKEVIGLLYRWTENYNLVITIAVIFILYVKQKDILSKYVRNEFPLIFAWLFTVLFMSVTVGSRFISGRLLIGIEFWGILLITRYFAYWGYSCKILKATPFASCIFVSLLFVIIDFQGQSGKVFRRLYSECVNVENRTVSFCFPTIPIPNYFQKYVYYRHEIGQNEVWDAYYSDIYKKDVDVWDEEALTCMTQINKVKGSNPFYSTKDYIYTTNHLPSNIRIKVYVGDYKQYDFFSALKRAYFFIKKDLPSPREYEYQIQTLHCGSGKTVNRVQFSLEKNVREIEKIDVFY